MQAGKTRTAQSSCGRYLVCLKHSKEAPVVGVERVRRDEEREVMAMTGLSSQVGLSLF